MSLIEIYRLPRWTASAYLCLQRDPAKETGMNRTALVTRTAEQALDPTPVRAPAALAPPRPIVFRTGGRRGGPVVRLVSPSDIGRLIKPFVFLDHAEVRYTGQKLFGIHPHS